MSILEQIKKMEEQEAQLRTRRATLVARLESLQASMDEARLNLSDLDDLALTLADMIISLNVGSPPAPEAVPAKRASGNPKKEVVAEAVHAIIKKEGRPLSRAELYARLGENGVPIHGANPEMVLSTMLWRAGDAAGIVRLKSGGYWLKSIPWALARYDPDLVEQLEADGMFDDLLGSDVKPDVFD